MYLNLLVASSNLYGLKIFHLKLSTYQKILISSMILASSLMHLSEVKHNLPGIYPFSKYSNEFLWYDRIMAFTCIIYGGYQLKLNHIKFFNKKFLIKTLFGFSCLAISENVGSIGQIGFAISHITWHLLAYDLMYQVLE